MAVDHTAAYATFVEISFGVNTLFAAYERLHDRFAQSLADKVAEAKAQIKTNEEDSKVPERIQNLEEEIDRIAAPRLALLEEVQRKIVGCSIFAAILCVLVVYFDLLMFFGPWLIVLILPFPLFSVFYFINYRIFLRRQSQILKTYSTVRNWEKPRKPDLPF